MRLQIYLTKRLVGNPLLIFWGLLFMLFWAVMGAFVESAQLPPMKLAEESYTAGYAGVLVLLSFSSIGVVMTKSVTYQSGSIPYLLRYSRMKNVDYLSGLTIAGLLSSLVYSLSLIAIVDVLFSYHFGFQIPPADIALIVLSALLSGLFFTFFSLTLELVRIKFLGFNPATSQAVDFIPLILGYLFGFGALYLNLNDLVYLSPFSDVEYLVTEGYYGHKVPLNALGSYTSHASSTAFSPELGLLTLSAWIVVLSVVSLLFFNRIYYRNINEGSLV